MASEGVTDHKWHNIKSQDLPDWVKRSIQELNQHSLKGKSFEYRWEPTTGRYQRKLRRHPPQVVVWTKHAVAWSKRNLGKAFTISSTARKLLLSLLVIISLVLAVQTGYLVFTHQAATVKGTIMFLAELGVLFWLISILRSYRYRRRKPSFKLVFFSLVGIALVCAFAGIEPLASYKDWTGGFIVQSWETYQKEKAQRETQALIELEEETFRLINVERGKRGIPPVVWNEALHDGAREHSESMQERGDLYHDTYGQYAECCYGASYASSIYDTAEATVEAWMSSTAGHREILLNGQYRQGAVGIARDEGFWATYRCY